MKTIMVSIIMGIYNCEKTLSEAIDSILAQSFTDWELIMCDDGSTDDTYDIAKSYADQMPDKIILLRNTKNIRLAATLNRCLEFAQGAYIARMDADDINLPDRLEKEVEFLETHPEIDCVGTARIIFDEHGELGIRCGIEKPDKYCLIHGTPCAHPTIMIRREAYATLGGYSSNKDTARAEDLDLWFRFFQKGFHVYNLQQPLYKYRESISDYYKRSLKAAVGTTRVYLRGYRMLHFPFYAYPFAFKPIISALLPNKLMYYYHQVKDRRNRK